MATLAQAEVVAFQYSDGAWGAGQQVLAGTQNGICMNLYANQYMAVGPNGADSIQKSGSTWSTSHISDSTSYTSVAWNSKSYDSFIAPRTSGGVDYLTWSSRVDTGLTGSYTAVSKNQTATAPNQYFGVTAGGAVNMITKSGSAWQSYQVSAANGYTAVASNNYEDQAFVLNANGLNFIRYSGGWQTSLILGGSYNLLAADDEEGDFAYIAGPDGLGYCQWSSGSWTYQQINTKAYMALAPIGGTTRGVFGALASGGLEEIYWNGSAFVSGTITDSGLYSHLSNDYSSGLIVMAVTVPEPATLGLLAIGGMGALLRKKRQ